MSVSFASKPSTPGTSFNSTRECLSTMLNLLKCVNCSEVPRDDIWTPGDCNHKYCKSCIKKLTTNKCTICEVKSLQKDRSLDVFSTNLLEELRTFVAQVREEYELSDSEVGLEFALNSVVPTTAERADSEDKDSVISSLRCNSDGDDDQPPTPGTKNTKETNGGPKIFKKSSSSSTPKSTTKSTPVKNGATPKLNVSSTPDILARLFDNDHESDEHSDKDVEVDNEDVNHKNEYNDEDGDSDIEIDKDLPVLTPVPLSQTRAMSRKGTVESSPSVQSPFKSPQPKQNRRTPKRKDIPVLTPHTTSATLNDASRDSGSNSDGEEPVNSLTTRRTKKKNSLQPEIWLERVDDDNSTHRGSKKPKNLLKSEGRATKNKGKKIQHEPVEIGSDDDPVDPKLSDDEISLTSSNLDSDSDSEFKTPKSKRKTPLGTKPKALSTSATGRSHLKSESLSPFGIKPVDSTETLENKKRFFQRGLLSSRANRSTLASNSRSEAKPGITKPNPFVSPPTSHRRSSTGSNSAFTAVKSKKLGIKEKSKMGDGKVKSCATTPIAKTVYDFHGTQSQVISPLKKLSGVTHENDKGSTSTTKRRRTPSLSSLGSSVASSSEDLESTLKNSKTTGNTIKRAKELSTNIKRGRPPSVASSNSTTASNKNSPSGVAGVGKRNRKGETPLHLAARDGQFEKLKQFIEDGGDIDAKDYAGWTPLHEAINGKVLNFEVVKLLCSSGCDVNALGMYDETPLHEACRLGLTNVVSYLLSQSASPAIRNSAGKLPRDVTNSDAVIKIMSDYEKQNTGQSQVNNDVSVELKISLQKAVFYFNYKPSKDVLKSCKSILDMNIATELTSKVTHLILDVKPKSKTQLSREYLLSILNGCWMLSSKWLEDSISVKRFLDPRKYEVGGCHYKNIPSPTCDSAIERARVNREHGNPGLFDGMHFYLYKGTSWPSKVTDQDQGKDQVVPTSCALSKKDIAKLITFGSGKVINREPDPEAVDPLETPLRFHASTENANTSNHKLVLTSHVILYDDKNVPPKKYDMEHVKTLRIDWLIHSAINFQLIHPDSYLE